MIECGCGQPLFPHMRKCPQCAKPNPSFSSRGLRLTAALLIGLALLGGCLFIPPENAAAWNHVSYLVIGVVAYLVFSGRRR